MGCSLYWKLPTNRFYIKKHQDMLTSYPGTAVMVASLKITAHITAQKHENIKDQGQLLMNMPSILKDVNNRLVLTLLIRRHRICNMYNVWRLSPVQ